MAGISCNEGSVGAERIEHDVQLCVCCSALIRVTSLRVVICSNRTL